MQGGKLNIGKPILTEDEADLKLSVELGRHCGIFWRTPEQGLLLNTVKVSQAERVESE